MIILQDEQGNSRLVPEGEEYILRPGEHVAGSTTVNEYETLSRELESEGVMLGDLVAGAIHKAKLDKLFGKTDCTACHRRQQILNEWHRRGKAFIKDLLD